MPEFFHYSNGRYTTVDLKNYTASLSTVAPCPNRDCRSTRINLVRMPDYSIHYAARKCAVCDSFRGWESNPANQEKRQRRQATIAALLKSLQLTQWERNFLERLKGKKVSPKQQEVLSRIEVKVGVKR